MLDAQPFNLLFLYRILLVYSRLEVR